MSLTCEITQPSRNSKKIIIQGSEPYNEGSSDTFEVRLEDQPIPRINITPQISVNRKNLLIYGKKNSLKLNRENFNFLSENSYENELDKNSIEDTSDTDLTVLNRDLKTTDAKSAYPLGFNREDLKSQTFLNNNSFFQDRTYSRSDYRPIDIVSFTELELLELSVSSSLNFEQIFNNLEIETNNGAIEPFVLRDLGSNQIPADFPVKTIKSDLCVKDVRNRSYLFDIYESKSSLEFFEESNDIFALLSSINLKEYVREVNTTQAKESFVKISYKTVAKDSFNTYKPKSLDMSWISDDNTFIKPFVDKDKTIFQDIKDIDIFQIKTQSLLNHINTKCIQTNSLKKGLKKYTTGYDLDNSKSFAMESIAFNGLLE